MAQPVKVGETFVAACQGCHKLNRITYRPTQKYRCGSCRRTFSWDDLTTRRRPFGADTADMLRDMMRKL